MILDVHKVDAKRPYPPRVSAFTERFWSDLSQGRHKTTQCGHCGRQTFPPKVVCPHCWSHELEWVDMPMAGGTDSLLPGHTVCRCPVRLCRPPRRSQLSATSGCPG